MNEATPGAVVLHERDDVAVLLRPALAGQRLTACGALGPVPVTATVAIPMGHKIALRALSAGAPVRKHGEAIGILTADVTAGDHVHVHNLRSARGAH